MSDEKDQLAIFKAKEIQSDAVITVDIGAGFYTRFQELMFWYVNQEPADKSIKALEALKDREPKDKFEYHLITMLSLVYSIEDAAAAQGKMQEREHSFKKKEG